jgi:hypothetical protein
VILNTSFNLKGEPIVETPAQAFNTFSRSEMDVLYLRNFIIEKDAKSIIDSTPFHLRARGRPHHRDGLVSARCCCSRDAAAAAPAAGGAPARRSSDPVVVFSLLYWLNYRRDENPARRRRSRCLGLLGLRLRRRCAHGLDRRARCRRASHHASASPGRPSKGPTRRASRCSRTSSSGSWIVLLVLVVWYARRKISTVGALGPLHLGPRPLVHAAGHLHHAHAPGCCSWPRRRARCSQPFIYTLF